jgi:3-dehydroquinate synthase
MMQIENIDISGNIYQVIVGSDIADKIDTKLFVNKKVIFIIDQNVHIKKYQIEIAKVAKSVYEIKSPFNGEDNKTYLSFEFFCEQILSFHPNRKNTIIVIIGGGAIGDMGHFVGASILRGIDVVRIPTTLLSMVDSSIGGKTCINSAKLKNMIGCFDQPKLVICDIDFLITLSRRELLSGYAELLKHALIFSSDMFNELDKNIHLWDDINEHKEWLTKMISKSILIKYHFIKDDELDTKGQRAILNFGHTVGHAIEGYQNSNYFHGEAIAMGMYIEAKIFNEEIAEKIKLHLQKIGLFKADFIKQNPAYLIHLMSGDKKIELDKMIKIDEFCCQEKLPIIMLSGIGSASLNIGVDHKIILNIIKNIAQDK